MELKEYKKLVHKMSKLAEANEPETLGYHFYFNRDKTKYVPYPVVGKNFPCHFCTNQLFF